MAIWLVPLGYAAAAIGGAAAAYVFGGSKKDMAVSEQHATKEHYAPVTTDARAISKIFAPTYQYQIESPGARMKSTKKLTSAAESYPDISTPRTHTAPGIETTEGLDMTKIAIIGVVGLIAYGVVSKK
jgi:hypothetical protein